MKRNTHHNIRNKNASSTLHMSIRGTQKQGSKKRTREYFNLVMFSSVYFLVLRDTDNKSHNQSKIRMARDSEITLITIYCHIYSRWPFVATPSGCQTGKASLFTTESPSVKETMSLWSTIATMFVCTFSVSLYSSNSVVTAVLYCTESSTAVGVQ